MNKHGVFYKSAWPAIGQLRYKLEGMPNSTRLWERISQWIIQPSALSKMAEGLCAYSNAVHSKGREEHRGFEAQRVETATVKENGHERSRSRGRPRSETTVNAHGWRSRASGLHSEETQGHDGLGVRSTDRLRDVHAIRTALPTPFMDSAMFSKNLFGFLKLTQLLSNTVSSIPSKEFWVCSPTHCSVKCTGPAYLDTLWAFLLPSTEWPMALYFTTNVSFPTTPILFVSPSCFGDSAVSKKKGFKE